MDGVTSKSTNIMTIPAGFVIISGNANSFTVRNATDVPGDVKIATGGMARVMPGDEATIAVEWGELEWRIAE